MRSIHLSILLCLILFNLAFAFDKQRDCKCLSPNTGYRVVNGKNASDGSYPWQLSLQLGDSFKVRLINNSIEWVFIIDESSR